MPFNQRSGGTGSGGDDPPPSGLLTGSGTAGRWSPARRGLLDNAVIERCRLRPGMAWQPARTDARALGCLVESGLAKRVHVDSQQVEHVLGFLPAGAVNCFAAGIDLSARKWVALQPTQLLVIDMEALPKAVRHEFAAVDTARCREEYFYRLSTSQWSTAQQVAAFLSRLSDALKRITFRLPMPLGDMANYLGLSESALRDCLKQLVHDRFIRLRADVITVVRPVRPDSSLV